jgi:hypothetical protein
MRRSLVITILLLSVASVAQAHSIVSVVLQPALFMSVGVSAETIGASFPWDPTTRTLSNFVVTTQGPLPAFSRRIQLLDFSNAEATSSSWIMRFTIFSPCWGVFRERTSLISGVAIAQAKKAHRSRQVGIIGLMSAGELQLIARWREKPGREI